MHSCLTFYFILFLKKQVYDTQKGQSIFHTTNGPFCCCSHGRSLCIARPIIAIAAVLGKNCPSSSSDNRPAGFVACLPCWPGPSRKTGVPPWHHLPIQRLTLFSGIGGALPCTFPPPSKLCSSLPRSIAPVSLPARLQGSATSNQRLLCLGGGGLSPTFGLLEPGTSGSGTPSCRRLSHLSLGSAPIGG